MVLRSALGLVAALTLSVATLGIQQPNATAEPDRAAAGPSVARANESTGRGDWTIEEPTPGSYVIAWTSPDPLPVIDAAPTIVSLTGASLGPTVSSGRTLKATVDTATPPDPTDYDVVLSGRVLDEVDTPLARPVDTVRQLRATDLQQLDVDPGVPGSHEIRTVDYRLPSVKVPDIPMKVEMLGHIVEPVDATVATPLALFLHGRHDSCYLPGPKPKPVFPTASEATRHGSWQCPGKARPVPSYLGFDYVQRLLATQGFVTVSISANAINNFDDVLDYGSRARAALIRAHLQSWNAVAHPADLSNVVMIGHSRGGVGAYRASLQRSGDTPYQVSGLVMLAAINRGAQASPAVPTVSLLPYCDGDVISLAGQVFVDAARDIGDAPALHSSVLMLGANHNYFNTEWTPGISEAPSHDDARFLDPEQVCGRNHPDRLDPAAQRKAARTYIAGAVRLFALQDRDLLPMFDGSRVAAPSAGEADVRSHALGGGLDVRSPGIDADLSTPVGARTRLCRGQHSLHNPRVCAPGLNSLAAPHWPWMIDYWGAPVRLAFEMSWTGADQSGGLTFDRPWDLAAAKSIDIRTIVDPESGPVKVRIRLHDSEGRTAVVIPDDDGRLAPLPQGGEFRGKRWAQPMRLSLSTVTGIELSRVTGIDIVSSDDAGHIWVLDLAAMPHTGIPSLQPGPQLPTISLGTTIDVENGDGRRATMEVPYRINGPELTQDARVRVDSPIEFTKTAPPRTVTIPAGTRSGTFDVVYKTNRTDDVDRRSAFVTVFALQGVVTDRYVSKSVLLDDEPAPRLSIEPVSRTVREGHAARWLVTVSPPPPYQFGIRAEAVSTGDRAQLAVGDLPRGFAKRHFDRLPDLDTPLGSSGLRINRFVFKPGTSHVLIKLPTARDNRDEGRRTVALRFSVAQIEDVAVRSRVVVTD